MPEQVSTSPLCFCNFPTIICDRILFPRFRFVQHAKEEKEKESEEQEERKTEEKLKPGGWRGKR